MARWVPAPGNKWSLHEQNTDNILRKVLENARFLTDDSTYQQMQAPRHECVCLLDSMGLND